MTRKSLVAVWRDAVRDSDELDRTAKLVAFCLSTYMNGHGFGWPSQDTLAAGASITDRAVYSATLRLESTGFLEIERSRGRSSHRYAPRCPQQRTPFAVQSGPTANGTPPTANGTPPTPNAVPPKALKALKAACLTRRPPLGAAPLAR